MFLNLIFDENITWICLSNEKCIGFQTKVIDDGLNQWCRDIQHNDTQNNDAQHNAPQEEHFLTGTGREFKAFL